MLSAIAGADALEIVVLLKNMASTGLTKLQADVAKTESRVNSTNFSGFSNSSKKLETDAEKAAGKAEGGGGGIGNMISSAIGLPGPLLLAGAAVGGFAALAQGTIPVYEKSQEELKAMTAAAKAHGISMDDLMAVQKRAEAEALKYGVGIDDVRQSMEAMTIAGLTAAQQQEAMPAILDLSIAKNKSMADSTDLVVKAMMGQTKGLIDLGVKLPPVSASAANLSKAQASVATATQNAQVASQELSLEEQKLAGKHKLTAAEALALEKAQIKVTNANTKLKAAQAAVTLAEQGGIDKGKQLQLVIDKITGSTGDQSASVSDLKKAQAALGNEWDRFSITVAPVLIGALVVVLKVLDKFIALISKAIDLIANLGSADAAKTVKDASGGNLQFVGGKYGAMPKNYASGGLIKAAPGGTVVNVGEGGEDEYIIPASRMGRMGGGSVTNNVYIQSIWPPTAEQAKQIAQTVTKHLARNLNVAPRTTRPYGSV